MGWLIYTCQNTDTKIDIGGPDGEKLIELRSLQLPQASKFLTNGKIISKYFEIELPSVSCLKNIERLCYVRYLYTEGLPLHHLRHYVVLDS